MLNFSCMKDRFKICKKTIRKLIEYNSYFLNMIHQKKLRLRKNKVFKKITKKTSLALLLAFSETRHSFCIQKNKLLDTPKGKIQIILILKILIKDVCPRIITAA